MLIFCTKCRREQSAERCTVLGKVQGGRRPVRLWANRCQTCGTAHVAPDPTRVPARSRTRAAQREQRTAEQAGQLSLFRERGR